MKSMDRRCAKDYVYPSFALMTTSAHDPAPAPSSAVVLVFIEVIFLTAQDTFILHPSLLWLPCIRHD